MKYVFGVQLPARSSGERKLGSSMFLVECFQRNRYLPVEKTTVSDIMQSSDVVSDNVTCGTGAISDSHFEQ